MKKQLLFLCLVILAILPTCLHAQEKALPAQTIMAEAYKKATETNKKVLLIFHASWCGWCKKMDAAIQDETCQAFFNENFVIVHLTVDESAKKAYLENEGAANLRDTYGGKGLGLPYWAFLDNAGKVLGDARMPNGYNTGCPANKEEVQALITILQKTTTLSAKNLEIISTRFLKNAQ